MPHDAPADAAVWPPVEPPAGVDLNESGVPGWTVEACEDYYPNHPTIFVLSCSPDPVLTHDGATSQACRSCGCGRARGHAVGCTAGRGPAPPLTADERWCLDVTDLADRIVEMFLGLGDPNPEAAVAAVRVRVNRRWPHDDMTIHEFSAARARR